MRLLPDKPSLDLLRQEAKDLLAALRESTPDTSLAQAQNALAAQYGMRDWVELKSEAERRAAEAPAAPDGLAVALATAFGLGRVTSAASPIAFRPMGRCWSLTTDGGRWLAATVYHWITEAQAEVGARLRDAAVAAGVAAPTPVRSPQGRLIEDVHGEQWRIHEWIEVGPIPVTPTTAVLDLRTIEADVDGTATILCNLIPENVRSGHNGDLVVTEWDFAGSWTPEVELAHALTHWTLRPSITSAAIAAFRDGYVKAAGAWPELGLASFGSSVTAWLNWAYNTVCEAIDPTDGDRAAFADRETMDLLDCPMTRSSLQQLLESAA